MTSFQYYLPSRVVFGCGTVERLPTLIDEHCAGKDRILLVTGRSALRKVGIIDRLLKLLESKTVMLFDKVEANPDSTIVHEGIELYRHHRCTLIVAVGGGSVLDVGKAIAILVNNTGTLEEYQRGGVPKNPPEDFVAVPTTSGTSSEMSIWSVITNLEGEYKHTKKSFSDQKMYPKLAVIDPELTLTLPAEQTASTGLDALCHAVEGHWSKKNNPLSSVYALQAIALVTRWLPRACTYPDDLQAREQMSFAMFLAGLCFSNSRTTSPHKVSYPLTTLYNLPHGAACAITLPSFMEYIGEREPRHLDGLPEAMGQKTWQEAANFLRSFIKEVGMPNRLSELGVDEAALALIAQQSYVPIPKQEDPVPISHDDYLAVLRRAL